MNARSFIITFLTVLTVFVSLGQLNMNQVGHLDLNTPHNQGLNDIWGYTDETGKEYALVGGTKGTSVVDISDPSNPVEIFYEPGMESIWRDVKTWGDYAFVTTEAENGLLIIDLSPLPGGSITNTYYYTGPSGNEWQSAHNLYIDSSGYCYIFGANRGNGGVIILDVYTDPTNPVEVGTFDNWYVHDGYAANDTMYLGHIYEGFMSMVDVNDRSNPSLLGSAFTPSTFAHNVWSKGGNFAFTTDEVSGGYIGAFDISDPANIVEVDRIQSSPGSGVIPHNTHVLGNYIVTSYYSDGVVVHDVTHPQNMVEVANYDTYPDQTSSFDGCWGVYPYFASGLMVASDRTEGLFIIAPNLSPAAYLEGVVTDASSMLPLDQVEVQIVGSDQSELTASNGEYATGIVDGGSYVVIYSKVGYYPQTINVSLTNGVVTIQNAALLPIPTFDITVQVEDESTGALLDNVQIDLKATLITHSGQTNGLGEEDFTLFYQEEYEVLVGKWGYLTYCDNIVLDDMTGMITVSLTPAYYDDFSFDFGWSSTGTAATGGFVRDEPNGTDSGSQTDLDVQSDCGNKCFVTGNDPNLHPNTDDVDDGEVVLRSPVMDLSGYTDPYVNFCAWFYNYHGPFEPDDSLTVYVNNGLSGDIPILIIRSEVAAYTEEWESYSIRISDFTTLTSTMQFAFKTSDIEPMGNITEAAIDHFYVAEADELSLEEREYTSYSIYPNPAADRLNISGITGSFDVYNSVGALVLIGESEGDDFVIDVSGLANGVYIFQAGELYERFIVKN